VNRPAHALIPPFRGMNCSSGSETGLYAAGYHITRDHLLLVRLSAFAGSHFCCSLLLDRLEIPDGRRDVVGRSPGTFSATAAFNDHPDPFPRSVSQE
jgi:hypothetical protein